MSSAAAEATVFLRRMVEEERKSLGKKPLAIKEVAKSCRTSFWTINNILIGRAKTVDGDLRDRIRAAFVNNLRSHAARLLHEAEIAAATDNNNDDLRVVTDEIRALASRLEIAKSAPKAGARG